MDPSDRSRPPARDDRRRGPRAVADIVPGVGRAAFRRFGFVESSIVARWSEIVGETYARHSAPDALKWPTGKRAGATLSIVCESAFAPTLSHVEPQIVERVNRFFGYAAVARIAIRHGEIPKRRVAVPAAEPPPIPAEVSGTLRTIADPGLRASLESLARQIASTKGPPVFD